jgi:hypothetical protein
MGRGGPYLEATTFPLSPHYSILLSVAMREIELEAKIDITCDLLK